MVGLFDLSQEVIELILSHLAAGDLCTFRALSTECVRRCDNAFANMLGDLRFFNARHSMDVLLAISSQEHYASKMQSLRLARLNAEDHFRTPSIKLGPFEYASQNVDENHWRYFADEREFRKGADLTALTTIMRRMPNLRTIDIGTWDQNEVSRCCGEPIYLRDTGRKYGNPGPPGYEVGGISEIFAHVLQVLSTTERAIVELNVRQSNSHGVDGVSSNSLPELIYNNTTEETPLAAGLRLSFTNLQRLDICIETSGFEESHSTGLIWFHNFLHLAPSLADLKLTMSDSYCAVRDPGWSQEALSLEGIFRCLATQWFTPRLKSCTLQNFFLHPRDLISLTGRCTGLTDLKLHRVASRFDWEPHIRTMAQDRNFNIHLSWLERVVGPDDNHAYHDYMNEESPYPGYMLFSKNGNPSRCPTCHDLMTRFTMRECKEHTSKSFSAEDLHDLQWTLAKQRDLLDAEQPE